MYPTQPATAAVRSHTFKSIFFGIRLFAFLAVLSARGICLGQALPDLAVSAKDWGRSDVTIAPALARQSEPCRIYVRVHNNGEAEAKDVRVDVAVRGPLAAEPWRTEMRFGSIPAQSSAVDLTQFTPCDNGIYEVSVTVDREAAVTEAEETNNAATLEFPVVRRPVFILYHVGDRGALRPLRYQTHLTFGGRDANERAYWTRRGVDLLLHRTGSPTRSNVATVEQRVAYWAETGQDVIVDELLNRPGEEGVLMARAFRAFKEQYPHIRLAVWASPTPFATYYQGLRYADAVLPEVYLRDESAYRDTDWHLAAHRRAGFADRTYIALAVDSRRGKDADGRPCPRWASDAAEVERQVRSLRAARPEMMGVALYANFAEAPLIAEADALFGRYWVMPVLTLEPGAVPGTVKLSNIGAMDARDVVVAGGDGNGQGAAKVPLLEAGASTELNLPAADGPRTVRLRPAPGLTLLNHELRVNGP